MITASEARQQSNSNNSRDALLGMIEAHIKGAVQMGRHSTVFNFTYYPGEAGTEVRKVLVEHGYTLTDVSGDLYEISWK